MTDTDQETHAQDQETLTESRHGHTANPQDAEHQEKAFPSNAPTAVRRVRATPFMRDATLERLDKAKAFATMTRQQCFEHGYLTVEDLDDEELVAGRCRDEYGRIPKNGKKTELIPKDLYDDMVAEHELRFKQRLRSHLDKAITTMVEIMEDDTVEPRERFEAAKYLFERTAGKTPETVNINVNRAPYEELLNAVTGIAPMSRAEHRELKGAGIVDVEYAEVEDDETTSQHEPEPATNAQDTVQDDIPPQDVPSSSETPVEQPVVPVHQARPSEQPEVPTGQPGDLPHQGTNSGQKPVQQQPDDDAKLPTIPVGDHVQYRANNDLPAPAAEQRADVPNQPELMYGRRADEKRSYADQARAAEDLAKRRRASKDRIQNAKRQRKIARATGADAIEDDITGAVVADDGKLTFE